MSMAARVYRAALKAVEDLDVRVLLTAGRRFDLSELGPVPANTHVERWVEQSQILAVADLVVCHGGSGTVLGALSAGVPLVTVPLFADQFENSRRIAAMGAGAVVEVDADSPRGSRRQINDEDAPRIAEQIRRVMADRSYRRQARFIADEMASAAGVDDVLAELVAAAPTTDRD
jgi:MGT family glycosyltransferase